MEPIRFADILFVFLTLVITFAILWQVNKAKRKSKETTGNTQSKTSDTIVTEREDV